MFEIKTYIKCTSVNKRAVDILNVFILLFDQQHNKWKR